VYRLQKSHKYIKKVNCPLPHIDVLLDIIAGAKIYTALDLAQGYHQLRIKEDDQQKTTFVTQYGQWQWIVMPFGPTSAPSSFQRLLNYILKTHENPFVLVYLDDVLIFSNDLEEHLDHIYKILTLLNDNSIR
jgi:hypothetical protein